MNRVILSSCFALIVVLCMCLPASNAASIGHTRSGVAVGRSGRNERDVQIVARQAESDEESDEDDDEADIAQAQAQAIIQQQQFGSNEDSDEDGYDDTEEERRRRRRRRDVTPDAATEKLDKVEQPATTVETAAPAEIAKPAEAATPVETAPAVGSNTATTEASKEQQIPPQSPTEEQKEPAEATSATSATTIAPPKKPSVLILIRDALKKVTTLPTEQVATNALQYFQLFEHFLQQTIEEVIGDDDDDDEESTTIKPPDAAFEVGGIYTPVDETLSAIEELMQPELVTKTPAAQAPAPSEPSDKIEADKQTITATATATSTLEAPSDGVSKEQMQQTPAAATSTIVATTPEVQAPPEAVKVDTVNKTV